MGDTIKIVIGGGSSVEEGEQPSNQFEEVETQDVERTKTVRNGALNAVLINAGKQVLSQAVSNYGNITGDYMNETKIQEAMEMGNMVATSIAIGSAATPIAGVVAFSVQVGIKATTLVVDRIKANYDTEQLRERTGYSTTSGSR